MHTVLCSGGRSANPPPTWPLSPRRVFYIDSKTFNASPCHQFAIKVQELLLNKREVLFVIPALKVEEIHSIREAARIFQVPRSTLGTRYHGVQIKTEKCANGLKLSTNKEESLIEWLLDLAKRGIPPWPSLVR
jgi:hypothetical protein